MRSRSRTVQGHEAQITTKDLERQRQSLDLIKYFLNPIAVQLGVQISEHNIAIERMQAIVAQMINDYKLVLSDKTHTAYLENCEGIIRTTGNICTIARNNWQASEDMTAAIEEAIRPLDAQVRVNILKSLSEIITDTVTSAVTSAQQTPMPKHKTPQSRKSVPLSYQPSSLTIDKVALSSLTSMDRVLSALLPNRKTINEVIEADESDGGVVAVTLLAQTIARALQLTNKTTGTGIRETAAACIVAAHQFDTSYQNRLEIQRRLVSPIVGLDELIQDGIAHKLQINSIKVLLPSMHSSLRPDLSRIFKDIELAIASDPSRIHDDRMSDHIEKFNRLRYGILLRRQYYTEQQSVRIKYPDGDIPSEQESQLSDTTPIGTSAESKLPNINFIKVGAGALTAASVAIGPANTSPAMAAELGAQTHNRPASSASSITPVGNTQAIITSPRPVRYVDDNHNTEQGEVASSPSASPSPEPSTPAPVAGEPSTSPTNGPTSPESPVPTTTPNNGENRDATSSPQPSPTETPRPSGDTPEGGGGDGNHHDNGPHLPGATVIDPSNQTTKPDMITPVPLAADHAPSPSASEPRQSKSPSAEPSQNNQVPNLTEDDTSKAVIETYDLPAMPETGYKPEVVIEVRGGVGGTVSRIAAPEAGHELQQATIEALGEGESDAYKAFLQLEQKYQMLEAAQDYSTTHDWIRAQIETAIEPAIKANSKNHQEYQQMKDKADELLTYAFLFSKYPVLASMQDTNEIIGKLDNVPAWLGSVKQYYSRARINVLSSYSEQSMLIDALKDYSDIRALNNALKMTALAFLSAQNPESLCNIVGKKVPAKEQKDKSVQSISKRKAYEDNLLRYGVPARYVKYYVDYGIKEEVSPALLATMGKQESGFRPDVTSSADAKGIAQFIDITWNEMKKKLGFPDSASPYNPKYAIHAQASLMASLIREAKKVGYNEDPIALALAGYNAGFGAVRKHHGIPPFEETENYVKIINSAYRRLEADVRSDLFKANNPDTPEVNLKRNELVTMVLREVGNVEFNRNVLKYTKGIRREPDGDPWAWCADFVVWAANKSGFHLKRHPVVTNLFNDLVSEGNYVFRPGRQTPRPGDIAFYRNDGSNRLSHVNIVTAVDEKKGTFDTVGGNEILPGKSNHPDRVVHRTGKTTRQIRGENASVAYFIRLQ